MGADWEGWICESLEVKWTGSNQTRRFFPCEKYLYIVRAFLFPVETKTPFPT